MWSTTLSIDSNFVCNSCYNKFVLFVIQNFSGLARSNWLESKLQVVVVKLSRLLIFFFSFIISTRDTRLAPSNSLNSVVDCLKPMEPSHSKADPFTIRIR